MRTIEQLREAILESVPYLPPVFDPAIVSEAIQVSPGYISRVRKALNSLETDGRIYRVASVRKVKGRRPAKWSVDPHASCDGEIEDAIVEVLGRMPTFFTVWDLLRAATIPDRLAKDVVHALEGLAARQAVVRIPGRKVGRPGITNAQWSADPAVIAREAALQREIEMQRAQAIEETKAVFERLSDSFWELEPDST